MENDWKATKCKQIILMERTVENILEQVLYFIKYGYSEMLTTRNIGKNIIFSESERHLKL